MFISFQDSSLSYANLRNFGGGGGGGGGGAGGSGGGGGGGGGNAPSGDPTLNDSLSALDPSRQILLLLLRLQQDTHSVLSRLNYLETTIMSLKVSSGFHLLSMK